MVAEIEQRIAEWTHLPPEHGEPIQVLQLAILAQRRTQACLISCIAAQQHAMQTMLGCTHGYVAPCAAEVVTVRACAACRCCDT